MKREVRVFGDLETRESEDSKKLIVRGRPITYGTYAEMGGMYLETISKGAATDALADRSNDIFMVFNHKTDMPLARGNNETLSWGEDDEGVFIEADLSKTARGRQVYEEIKAGLIDKMSFAFTVDEGDVEWKSDLIGGKRREIRVINKFKRIYEFSPVVFPAYEATDIQARSAEEVYTSHSATVESEQSADLTEERERLDLKLKLHERGV